MHNRCCQSMAVMVLVVTGYKIKACFRNLDIAIGRGDVHGTEETDCSTVSPHLDKRNIYTLYF